jgi:phage tail sheath protein FI
MADTILPGVEITIRDEGLISVSGVSVGTVGVVGTAADGDKNKVHTLSSFSDAKFGSPKDNTLLKTLELVFGNGARTVYAVRADDETAESYKKALALLENKIVNIVLLADQDASNTEMMTILKNHLNQTEKIRRERIGIVGCNEDVEQIATNRSHVANDKGRLIYVAPGITVEKRDPETDTKTSETLSGAYTAAAVAGLMASLPVQASPTNKVLNIPGDLAVEFNYGQLKQLVGAGVLTIEKRDGFRIVKGITTSKNSAWLQITTRRIVDKAIYGVRSACNPYIGKLNNERVRGAMKATIDSFLTRMVEEEALTNYTLKVSATREQEIAGQAIVDISLNPTFSIDNILVTMNLA